ncbi:S8 family serine peptidase, partial [Lusitaniella coriacea LEGE 07157]
MRLFQRFFKLSQSQRKPQQGFDQTFILEPILTPSGLVDIDGGDDGIDIGGSDIDLPDIADIDLPEPILDPLIDDADIEPVDFFDSDAPPDDSDFDLLPLDNLSDKISVFEQGVFTVGDSGEVSVDFLFDGGGYEGELAIFNLEGMDGFDFNNPDDFHDFILEASQRALSDSEMGHVVISDLTEGARFSGTLPEGNFNSGDYQGVTTVQMNPGDNFAVMLVPNGSVQRISDLLEAGEDLPSKLHPLFSLSTANPDDAFHIGQIADVTGDGNTFALEDLRTDGWTDQDYNDIVFQVRGATGEAVDLDEVVNPNNDWRGTDIGQELVEYAESIDDIEETQPVTPDPDPDFPVLIDPQTGSEYIPGELLVNVNPDAPISELETLFAEIGVTDSENLDSQGSWQVWKFAPETDLSQIQQALVGNSSIESTELNYVLSIETSDPGYAAQWALNNTGQTGGTPDADIDAPEAWQRPIGSHSVKVAVVDTGIDYTHSDLAANMWRNPGEIAGDGIDNDGNGFVDDVYGYDFANNDSNPMDDEGHGTHVAGTIGAVGNNNIGIVGVSPNASLMALKFLGANGYGSTSGAIRAVDYAVNMGADVINASFGGGGYSQAFNDAIARANDSGTVFVAAAGNNGKNTDFSPYYPSNYDLPNVISVAATDKNDNLAGFSNFGRQTVDLGAPGVSILSTLPGNRYRSFNGTSMAAPHVAGAVALALSKNPNATPAQIKAKILASVDAKPSLQGNTVSGGRLNLANFLGTFNVDVTLGNKIDFNGDGKTDFLRQEKGSFASADTHRMLETFLSNGDGTFRKAWQGDDFAMNGDFTDLLVGDFNGDGKTDFLRQEKGSFASADTHRMLETFLSNGDGTFRKAW